MTSMIIINIKFKIQEQILSSNKEKARQLVGITGHCWPFFCSFWDTVIFRVVSASAKQADDFS
jgi:hypothetical protein